MLYIITGSIFHNVSLAAGHHHPDMWAEGDKIPDEMDWGLFQVFLLFPCLQSALRVHRIMCNNSCVVAHYRCR